MGLSFKIHTEGLNETLEALASCSTRAEHIVAQQVKTDTERFVPMRNGELRDGTQVKGNLIIYPGPYARYLYYGKLWLDPLTGSSWVKHGEHKAPTERGLTYHHPGTCSHWFEVSKNRNIDKWLRTAQEEVERELKR